MPQRSVVITGLGLVCPLGRTLEEVQASLSAGRGGIVRTDRAVPFPFAGAVSDFRGELDDFCPVDTSHTRQLRKSLKLMCREIQMGVSAAQRALLHAGVQPGSYQPSRFGVSFGSDHIVASPTEFEAAFRACIDAGQPILDAWGGHGMSQITPLWLLKYLPNMPASHVAILNDLRGPNNSITQREVSGILAIGEAAATIVRGAADLMLVGATGSSLNPLRSLQSSFWGEVTYADDLDPSEACRPFDSRRVGMVLGEGSAAVVLEEEARAIARGATLYGRVLGHGSSCVARLGAPDLRKAVAHAIRSALRHESRHADVGHVNPHGLGTCHGDVEEYAGLQETLGERLRELPALALKSRMGNLGAAGGLVELMISLLAVRDGQLPQSVDDYQPDPKCPLQIADCAGLAAGSSVLKVNYTPSGQAAAIWIGR